MVPLAEIEEDAWDACLNTNLKAMWLCMKYEIRAMLQHGQGAIVTSASIYGFKPVAIGAAPYCASKFGPLNLSLRHEVARLIVWRVVRTRPAVPSAVSYEDVREGNDPYRALGHSTHSLLTGACTVREGRICQHQAETGLDAWYGEHR